MKKKEAIKLIKQYLPSTLNAVLIKEGKGKYSIAQTKECVDYQIRNNPEKIKCLYSFIGLPGKIRVTKVSKIKINGS